MNIKVIPIILILYLFVSDISFGQSCTCVDCPGEASVFTSTTFEFSLEGAVNNDLSSVDQSICQVIVQFTPEHIWSLEMFLTSPGGQTISLFGAPSNQFGFTGPLPWEILFLPCLETPIPDAGFSPVWNNNQNWQAGAFYNGSYHPYSGCLEDFNTGPVDGNWTLTVNNTSPVNTATIFDFQVIPCNLDGLDCLECEPDGGGFESAAPQNVCKGELALDFDLIPLWQNGVPDSSNYGYTYFISENDVLIKVDSLLDLRDLNQGTYQICGLSYRLLDSLEIPVPDGLLTITEISDDLDGIYNLFCASLSTNCLDITIIGHDTTFISDIECLGDIYVFEDTLLETSGTYLRTLNSSINCDSIIELTIDFIPPVDTIVNVQICHGQQYLFGGDFLDETGIYFWDSLSPVGCDSMVELHLEVLFPPITIIDTVLCQGEEIIVGPNTYNTSGNFELIIDTDFICDSLVRLNLVVLNPVAIIDNPIFLDCSNSPLELDASGSFGLNLSYIWTDVDNGGAGINSDPNQSMIDVVLDGEYELIIVDAVDGVSCADTSNTFVVADLNRPFVSVDAPTLNCENVAEQIITVPISTITDYSWSGPNSFSSTNQNPFITEAGIYELIVTGVNGCNDTLSYTIAGDTIPPLINLNVGDTIDCINDDILLSTLLAEPSFMIRWQGPGGFESTLNNISTSVAGTYSLTISNPANGCSADTSFTIVENVVLPDFTVSTTPIQCNPNQGSIVIESSTINQYSWADNAGFISNDSFLIVNSTGPYFLNITGENGCIVLDTLTAPIDTILPNVQINGTDISCSTPDATLIGSSTTPNVNYTWSSVLGFISNNNSILVSAVQEYTLTVQGENGCEDSLNYTTGIDTLSPLISLPLVHLNCLAPNQQIIPVSISSYNTILWEGPGSFSSVLANPIVNQSGNYTVTLTGVNDCVTTLPFTVTEDFVVPDLILVGDTTDCNNPVGLLTAVSILGDSIVWEGPNSFFSNDFNINPILSGTYTATVFGTNGCDFQAMTSLEEDFQAPQLTLLNPTIDCQDSLVLLGDSTLNPNWEYVWTGPGGFFSQSPFQFVNIPGNYQAIVEGENGCQTLLPVVVNIDTSALEVTLNNDTLDCLTTIITLSPEIIGNLQSQIWTLPGSVTDTDLNISILIPGDYLFVATGDNGCETMANATIFIDTIPPQISIDSIEITCTNPAPIVNINVVANDPSFIWTGPGTFSSLIAEPTITVEGIYEVTVMGSNGCEATAQMEAVDHQELPLFTVENDTLNCDSIVTNLQMNYSGNYNFLWSGPVGFSSILPTPEINVPGTYQAIVTDIDNGCLDSTTLEISIDTISPIATLENYVLGCSVSQVQLTPLGTDPSWNYIWTGPAGFGSLLESPVVGIPGLYELEITAPNGCILDLPSMVTSNDSVPILDFVFDTLSCLQNQASIATTTDLLGTIYEWTGPQSFTANTANITVNNPGIYEVTGTAPNGCAVIATVNIVADTIAPVFAISNYTLDCGAPILYALPQSIEQLSYSWWDPGTVMSSGDSLLIDEGGSYLIEAMGVNGCTAQLPFNVTEDFDLPQMTAIGGELNCQDTSINLNGTLLTAIDSFYWNGPNSFFSDVLMPTVNTSGEYQLIGIGTNGCVDSILATVGVDTLLPMASTSAELITCQDSLSTVSVNGGEPGWSYSWTGPGSFSAMTASFETAIHGLYHLTITGNNFCQSELNYQVIVAQQVPEVIVMDSILNCTNPSITIVPDINLPVATYSWSDGISEISVDPDLMISDSGIYFLNIVAVNGCTGTTSFVVTEDLATPDFTFQFDTITCTENTAQLNLNSTIYDSVFWTGPQSFTATELQPIVNVPGLYDFELVGENGCDTIGQIEIVADTLLPMVQLNGGTLNCAITDVNLAVIGIFETVSWNGPNSFQSIEVAPNVNQSGWYIGEFENANGCSTVDSVFVIEDVTPPTISLQGDTLDCVATQIDLALITPDLIDSIQWTGPDSFSDTVVAPTIDNPGWYFIAVTAVNGCIALDSILITEDVDLPQIDVQGDTLDCTGLDALVSADINGLIETYDWTGPNTFTSSTPISVVTAPGIYSLEITGFNGCQTDYQVDVLPEVVPTALNILGDNFLNCNSTTQILSTTTAGINFPFTVNWTLNNSSVSQDTILSIAEAGTYYLEILNTQNQCSNLDSIIIQQDTLSPEILVDAINGLSITCDIPAILLQGFVNGTPMGYSYAWVFEGDTIGTADNIEVSDPGLFTFIVNDLSNGCSEEQEVEVDQSIAVPNIELLGNTILNCYEPEILLTTETNLTSDFELSWFQDGVSIPLSDTTSLLSVDQAGVYLINIINQLNGCNSTDSILIESNFTTPDIGYDQSNELDCFNPETTISFVSSGQGVAYYWIQAGDTLATNSEIIINTPGSIILEAMLLENGCIEKNTIDIAVGNLGPQELALDLLQPVCPGEPGALTLGNVSGGIEPYLFSFNEGPFVTTPFFPALLPNNYNLVVQDADGCELESPIIINPANPIDLELGEDQTIELGDSIMLSPDYLGNIDQFNWADPITCLNCSNTFVAPLITTDYLLEVIDDRGCIATDRVRIYVKDKPAGYFPNVFSPNNDGSNDVYQPFFTNAVERVISFGIYSRWGEQVFGRDDVDPNLSPIIWDGMFRGKRVNPAVFVYQAEVLLINGETIQISGDLTVIH